MRSLRYPAVCCLVLFTALTSFAQTRIVCLGDSITYGYNPGTSPAAVGGPNDGYLPHMKRWLEAHVGSTEVINRGSLGENSVSALARVDSVLASTSPDIVLIMSGTNDVTNISRFGNASGGVPTVISNLSGLITSAQAHGAQPILATIPPRNGGPNDANNSVTSSLNASIRSLASSRGVVLADQERHFQTVNPAYFYSDPLHPNTPGYQLMAERFAASVAAANIANIDLVAPVITSFSPWPSSVTAGPNGPIRFSMQEFGSSFDMGSFEMLVNDVLVEPFMSVSATQLNAEYTPEPGWALGQRITVSLTMADLGDPANVTDYSYWFRVSAGNGTGGDIDSSGRVDGADLIILGLAFGSSWGDERYRYGADVDANLVVDGNDLAMLAAMFGSHV